MDHEPIDFPLNIRTGISVKWPSTYSKRNC